MSPSVADIMAFNALPDETRAMVARLVGGDPTEPGAIAVSASDAERAFRAGWDACADEIFAPGYDTREFKRWQERLAATSARRAA